MQRPVSRRAALAAAGLLSALAACGTGRTDDAGASDPTGATEDPMTERLTYGDDPSQWADLRRPDGASRGVVVVIHGGFWKAEYDASLGEPLATDLTARGWTTLNVEYRRVGDGGGFPATFDDVHAAIEALAGTDVDTSTVVTLGHSAGGHLATWAAARGEHGWPEQVAVTHVISQAGVLDLRAAFVDDLGGGAVAGLLGHAPTSGDARFDPAQQLPLDVPVWCVHASDDTIVPLRQSVDYVVRAGATGARAELVEVDGDHFVVIDPTSPAWARQLAILDTIG